MNMPVQQQLPCCIACRVVDGAQTTWLSSDRLCCIVLCCAVLCCAGGKGKAVSGSVIRATIPYVKADIPILVLFRALGTVVSTAAAQGASLILFT